MRKVRGKYKIRLKCGYVTFKERKRAAGFALMLLNGARWIL